MSIRAEAVIQVPHGVVFVYDPTMIVDVPMNTGEAPVLATTNCISLWTLAEDDGPTLLILADSCQDEDCRLVFQGMIEAEGSRIAFNTSSCVPVIETELAERRARISIYSNDVCFPSKLVCVVAPMLDSSDDALS